MSNDNKTPTATTAISTAETALLFWEVMEDTPVIFNYSACAVINEISDPATLPGRSSPAQLAARNVGNAG
jgi:hypothetical protein